MTFHGKAGNGAGKIAGADLALTGLLSGGGGSFFFFERFAIGSRETSPPEIPWGREWQFTIEIQDRPRARHLFRARQGRWAFLERVTVSRLRESFGS